MDIFIFILILVFVSLLLYSRIKLEGFKQIVIELIVEAEKQIEKGKNNEKFLQVLSQFKEFLPPIVKVFVSENMMISFIQTVFDNIKEALDVQAKETEQDIKEEIRKIEEEQKWK